MGWWGGSGDKQEQGCRRQYEDRTIVRRSNSNSNSIRALMDGGPRGPATLGIDSSCFGVCGAVGSVGASWFEGDHHWTALQGFLPWLLCQLFLQGGCLAALRTTRAGLLRGPGSLSGCCLHANPQLHLVSNLPTCTCTHARAQQADTRAHVCTHAKVTNHNKTVICSLSFFPSFP